jgi:hypothetical protein
MSRHAGMGRRYGRPVLHLRLIVPVDCTDRARSLLADHQGVTNLVVLPGASIRPEGDLLLADVARESANHVLDELAALGVTKRGSISVEGIDLSMSSDADRAENQAPGEGSDAVVWADWPPRPRRSRRCRRPTCRSSRWRSSLLASPCCWTRRSSSSAR